MGGREGQGRGARLGAQGEAGLLVPCHPSSCTPGTVAIARGRGASFPYPSRASSPCLGTWYGPRSRFAASQWETLTAELL